MRFGKREQIVGLGVFTIIAIGLLHMMVFGPRAERFIKVQEELAAAKEEGENVALLENPRDLAVFREKTAAVKAGFDDVLSSLSLARPVPFYPPSGEGVKIDPIKDPALSPKQKTEAEAVAKALKVAELRKAREEEQIALVFEEIRKLRAFTPDNEEQLTGGSQTRFPFLLRDWQVPKTIPEGAQGARLRDNFREALGVLEILEMVGGGNPVLREEQVRQFNQKILDIGVDNAVYQAFGPNSLAAQGQYVPLIHKLSIAMMLEEQLEASKNVGGEEIDRKRLYELIELHLPLEPLAASDIDADLGISDFYFLYESLHFVNELLAMAREYGVVEITTLTMNDPSYLADLGPAPLPWSDAGAVVVPYATPIAPSPYTQGKQKLTQLALRPADTSLGYCIPFNMRFIANNRVGWTFLYGILERFRLAELDELRISSIASSQEGELNWQVRVLHVPLLLATDVEPAVASGETRTEGGS